jgi:mannosyltransferase
MARFDSMKGPAAAHAAPNTADALPSSPRSPAAREALGARSFDWFASAVVSVLVLGLICRLPTLGSRSIWMDEAYSFWFANLSWTDLWTKTPFYETHPPFYYSLLKLWMGVAGSSEIGMRSLSVIASLATIAVTAFAPRLIGLGKRYDRVGLLAAALLALNAGNIEYAQQARPYALQTLFCTLMILASAAWLRRMLATARHAASLSGEWPLCFAAGLFAGITLWLHDTSPFIVLGNWLGLFAAIAAFSPYRRHDLVLSVKSLAIGLLIWAPCVPIVLIESRTVQSAFWATISPKMLTWPLTLATGGKLAFFPVAALFALGWRELYRIRKGAALYVLAMLFIPMAAVFAVSYLIKPIFVVRTFEWMAPPTLILAALGVFATGRVARLRLSAIPLVIVLCLVQDRVYYASATQDLRGLVSYLASERQPGDLILVYPNELAVGLDYYARQLPQELGLVALPAPYPAIGLHRPYLQSNRGVPAVVEADRTPLARLIGAHHRIWLVGDWPSPTGTMSVVADTLYRQRGLPDSSIDFSGTRVTLFGPPQQ